LRGRLAEIKGLKAKQRLTQRSTTYNGFFEVPTFEEVIDMVREAEKSVGRPIGIYAEIKGTQIHSPQT
jgi:glycerophosphoryl diester phosphodiesterase